MWGIQISRCIIYQYIILYTITKSWFFHSTANLHLSRPIPPVGSSHHCDEDGGCTCRGRLLGMSWGVSIPTLDASPSFLMDKFQQNLPSAQQKKHGTYRLTQYVLTGWSPWYDGPCADDTGSWLQPSSVIMAMPNIWGSTAQLTFLQESGLLITECNKWNHGNLLPAYFFPNKPRI